jgi:hypothetical protein
MCEVWEMRSTGGRYAVKACCVSRSSVKAGIVNHGMRQANKERKKDRRNIVRWW